MAISVSVCWYRNGGGAGDAERWPVWLLQHGVPTSNVLDSTGQRAVKQEQHSEVLCTLCLLCFSFEGAMISRWVAF